MYSFVLMRVALLISLYRRFAAGSQEGLDKAIASLKESLAKASSKTHRATLQVPQPLMPRIVGRAGVGLDLLRSDYDCEVDVLGKRNSDTCKSNLFQQSRYFFFCIDFI